MELEMTSSAPTKKKSKSELREVKAEDVESRESIEKRILGAAYIVD